MHIFDKILSLMLRPWFIVLFLGLSAVSYMYLDRDIALYFFGLHLDKKFVLLTWITNIGIFKLYLVGLPILAAIFAYVFRKKKWALKSLVLWVLVTYSSLIAYLLKTVFGRARPVLLFNKHEFGFYGWHLDGNYRSFPSGHTTTITSLFIGLIILFPSYFTYWATLCLLVMLSRIILTFHYLSDVLVSFYLVFLEIGLLTYIMRKKFPKTCELILK